MLEAAQCKLRGHARSTKEYRPRFYTERNEAGHEVRHEMREARDVCSRCGEPLSDPLGKWKPVVEETPA